MKNGRDRTWLFPMISINYPSLNSTGVWQPFILCGLISEAILYIELGAPLE